MQDEDRTVAGVFPGTRWSIVQWAGASQPNAETSRALEDICKGYWLPIYAFIRHTGFRPTDAEELTQEFLMRLVEGEYLAKAEREREKLRSLLLACVKHFLSSQSLTSTPLNRGGGQVPISIDPAVAEYRYAVDPVDDLTPDAVFERRWAMSLMNQVMEGLGQQMELEGKRPLFDALLPFTHLEAAPTSIAEVAGSLGMNEAAVKMAISRLRHRLRDRLREAITETLAPGENLEAEILHLRSQLMAST